MVTVFWDTARLLRVDFLDYSINMNGEFYASLLKRLSKKRREKTWRDAKDVRLLGWPFAGASAQCGASTKRWTVAPKCYRICLFFMDLAPSGSDILPNMRKTLESYVFADNEEMIAGVMGMPDMFEIFFFKECLRAWVKSCDKFWNMNDDYTDQQTFFVFKSSSYLCSFMVGPRTFWTPLVWYPHYLIVFLLFVCFVIFFF